MNLQGMHIFLDFQPVYINQLTFTLPVCRMGQPVSWQVKHLLHHHLDQVNVRGQVPYGRHQAGLQGDQFTVNSGQGQGHAKKVVRLNLQRFQKNVNHKKCFALFN